LGVADRIQENHMSNEPSKASKREAGAWVRTIVEPIATAEYVNGAAFGYASALDDADDVDVVADCRREIKALQQELADAKRLIGSKFLEASKAADRAELVAERDQLRRELNQSTAEHERLRLEVSMVAGHDEQMGGPLADDVLVALIKPMPGEIKRLQSLRDLLHEELEGFDAIERLLADAATVMRGVGDYEHRGEGPRISSVSWVAQYEGLGSPGAAKASEDQVAQRGELWVRHRVIGGQCHVVHGTTHGAIRDPVLLGKRNKTEAERAREDPLALGQTNIKQVPVYRCEACGCLFVPDEDPT
jgi:hypothetical protein